MRRRKITRYPGRILKGTASYKAIGDGKNGKRGDN